MDTQNVISIAKISEYLWGDNISQQNAFKGGVIDPRKAMQLYMERKALEYGYDQGLSGVQGTTLYVYALCGAMVNAAAEILANGSSGGSVVPGGGGVGVREYGAFASEGLISIVFPDAVNATLLYASRGANTVTTILTSGTPTGQQVLWTSSTGTLTVASDVPFFANEFIRILVK